MPYTPRSATTASCAHCGQPFEQRNLRRKYCSNSCNVLASYARTGSREARPSKADLERSLVTLIELMTGKERAAAPAPEELVARAKEIKAKMLEEGKERLRQAAVGLKARLEESAPPPPKKRKR